jgi:multiple sugar transport system ATP-binding protein
MSKFELQNVAVKLGSVDVLQNLCLRIESGDRLALMGASGAGKSTLLRVMAGLQGINSGKFLIDGQETNPQSRNYPRIALLSQDYALYPQLNVQQNIAAALTQLGMNSHDTAQRIKEVSQWFEIESLQSRLPSQLSGGQAQRVAFAKALARQPQLLLLDEPFSQVDRSLRNQLIEVLLPTCEQINTAICWVTHDPQEAFHIGTRIAILNAGRLVQDGTAEEIYGSPVSSLVAELTSVLPINWLPLDHVEFGCLRDDTPAKYVGVRPEHFSFSAGPGPSFEFKVQRIRFLGFARLVQGLIGQTSVQVFDLEHRCGAGDQIRVFLDPAKVLRCF